MSSGIELYGNNQALDRIRAQMRQKNSGGIMYPSGTNDRGYSKREHHADGDRVGSGCDMGGVVEKNKKRDVRSIRGQRSAHASGDSVPELREEHGFGARIGKSMDKFGKKVSHAVHRAADKTESGLKRAADKTGSGLKRADNTIGSGLRSAIHKTGKGLQSVGSSAGRAMKEGKKDLKGVAGAAGKAGNRAGRYASEVARTVRDDFKDARA